MQRSLEDYTRETPGLPSRCWVCQLPTTFREQVDAARQTGIVRRVVVEWLEECGFSGGTSKKLEGHYQRGHE